MGKNIKGYIKSLRFDDIESFYGHGSYNTSISHVLENGDVLVKLNILT
jgi:hypothetical protein